MRVIAGKYRGRTLIAPPGNATRPTSDRVRESLFSILGTTVVNANVLDLFAGSGALGIEALSRGAESVTFVDSSNLAVQTVRKNLRSLSLQQRVQRSEAVSFLRLANDDNQYDIVFIDPPYAKATELTAALSEELLKVLKFGALVIVESDRKVELKLNLSLSDQRRYGSTVINIYVND